MTGTAEIAKEIRHVTTLVDAARRLVEEGRTIELGQLEARIDACCAAVRDLPRGTETAEIRPAVTALLDEVGRLEGAIRKAQAEIGERLGQAGARRRALAAYGGGGR